MDTLALSRLVASLLLTGASLVVEDGKLILTGRRPSDLPEGVLDTLRAHRQELIEYLTPNACSDCAAQRAQRDARQ